MKKILIAIFLLAGVLSQNAHAQLRVSINIGHQPAWGPVGYDHADYYYLPDVDCYYDIEGSQFVYFDQGRWIYAAALPPRYGRVDLYRSYKVVVNEPRPYLHADVYRRKYARYKGYRQHQEIIRDSRDERYFESKDHPRHGDWEKKHGHDHDHDHDHH